MVTSRPSGAPAPRGGAVGVWVGRLGALLYLPVLFIALRDAEIKLPSPSLDHLRSAKDVMALVSPLLLGVLGRAALHVPLGFLLALAVPPRPTGIDRLARVFLPALLAGALLVGATQALLAGAPWSWPRAVDLALPVVGVAFGAWAGSAWSGGWRARRRFVASLTALAIVVLLGLAYAATQVLEAKPLEFAPTPVTSAEKRRIYGLFAGKNPTKLQEGQTESLSLAPHDVNLLLAWGLSLGDAERKAQVTFDTGFATLSASARVPGRRYLNVVAGAALGVEDGRLQVDGDALRIGRLDVPAWVVRFLSPAIVGALTADRRVKQALEPLREISIEPSSARIVYGHGELPRGFIADLFHGEGAGGEDLSVAQAHARHLIEVAAKLPTEGETRFGSALQAAFRFAAERSRKGDAVRENRGAILALGILIGDWHVQTLVGPVLDKDELKAGLHAYGGLKVRNRNDWTKHFTVSSALTVLSITKVSDAVGVFKEEMDAGGGSEGFSFGDLMADRSGTRFAEAATRDEASARAIQARLEGGFKVDDFFPPAVDLPEDMTDAALQARFGGVGGAGYKSVMAEIERRLARCAAYAPVPAPSAGR